MDILGTYVKGDKTMFIVTKKFYFSKEGEKYMAKMWRKEKKDKKTYHFIPRNIPLARIRQNLLWHGFKIYKKYSKIM